MKDYNFEVLKLKKDKINYLYRSFIVLSLIIILIFITVIFIGSKDKYINCNKLFNNDAGSFNYEVSIKISDGKISYIKGRQIVNLKLVKVTEELFEILNNDIINNRKDGLVLRNSLVDNTIYLDFKVDKVTSDNLNIINNLLGVYNIKNKSSVDNIIYSYEYEGYKCY